MTLTIGFGQDVDTFLPATGVLVIDYEVWNIQYATLTDKAASDFHNVPGLATSWKSSNHGKTWTYKLRPNLKWSDGQPLTSADVAYTINRARKEEWLNYTSTVANITATAPTRAPSSSRSSVPDPKLPTMDVYIVPEAHLREDLEERLTKYPAQDGVGSGPFTLDKYVKGQYMADEGEPQLLRRQAGDRPGHLPALHERGREGLRAQEGRDRLRPGRSGVGIRRPREDEGHRRGPGPAGRLRRAGAERLRGQAAARHGEVQHAESRAQGLRFRQAIAHAIDKKALVSRPYGGIGAPADALSPSAEPGLDAEDPEVADLRLRPRQGEADPRRRRLQGHGRGRHPRMPGGGKDIVLRYMVRSESTTRARSPSSSPAWLKDIGIGTKISVFNDTQLTVEIGKGAYDMFVWGWTPFVDPDPELSYFKCDQVAVDAKDSDELLQRRVVVRPRLRQAVRRSSTSS